MASSLHDRRPLAEWVTSGQTFEIKGKVSGLKRLTGIIADDLAQLDAADVPAHWRAAALSGSMAFGMVGGRLPVIDGNVQVAVPAVCQRCLLPLRLPLAANLQLLPVVSGKEAPGNDMSGAGVSGMPNISGYETWELPDATLCPAEVIEEALIMAMPFVATHADSDECRYRHAAAGHAMHGQPTNRLFADLQAQLDAQSAQQPRQ